MPLPYKLRTALPGGVNRELQIPRTQRLITALSGRAQQRRKTPSPPGPVTALSDVPQRRTHWRPGLICESFRTPAREPNAACAAISASQQITLSIPVMLLPHPSAVRHCMAARPAHFASAAHFQGEHVAVSGPGQATAHCAALQLTGLTLHNV